MSSTPEALLFVKDFLKSLNRYPGHEGSFTQILGFEAQVASTALSFAGGLYGAVYSGQVQVSTYGQTLARYGLAGNLTVSATDVIAAADQYGTSSPEYAQTLGKFAIEFGLAVALLAWGVPVGTVGIAIAILGIVLPYLPEITQPLGDVISFASEWFFNCLQQLVCDPLILDLDGDGIEVTPLDGSAVHFDYGGDGFAERTGWVSADDGLLVIDDNENGRVDGAVELFGSASQDGFAVLETLDGNHDGVIDAQDAAFARLRVWRDLNQNGVSDEGELQTLAQAGIASLSLTRIDLGGAALYRH